MLRSRLIVGNWKMHKTISEAKDLVQQLVQLVGDPVPRGLSTVLAPPFTALSTVSEALKGRPYLLGAQDLFWEDSGAFTGEVSGVMLKDVGCRYVIVGHSERRRYFGETDAMVRKKAVAALRHELRPLVCIGETWDQRLSGQAEHVLSLQLTEALAEVEKHQAEEVVIAYEPVWAIGSGRAATCEQVDNTHRLLRAQLIALWGQDAGARVPILYGGSVVPENIGEFLAISDVDGALVGGACLDPVLFAKILQIAGTP
jgi:triosephosphate isomerase (TIM)